MRIHPVHKLLEQHCYTSLLQVCYDLCVFTCVLGKSVKHCRAISNVNEDSCLIEFFIIETSELVIEHETVTNGPSSCDAENEPCEESPETSCEQTTNNVSNQDSVTSLSQVTISLASVTSGNKILLSSINIVKPQTNDNESSRSRLIANSHRLSSTLNFELVQIFMRVDASFELVQILTNVISSQLSSTLMQLLFSFDQIYTPHFQAMHLTTTMDHLHYRLNFDL
jgi:hypothetical protein